MATVIISRKKQEYLSDYLLKIYESGQPWIQISNGETLTLEVKPGTLKLKPEIGSWISLTRKFQIRENETLRLEFSLYHDTTREKIAYSIISFMVILAMIWYLGDLKIRWLVFPIVAVPILWHLLDTYVLRRDTNKLKFMMLVFLMVQIRKI